MRSTSTPSPTTARSRLRTAARAGSLHLVLSALLAGGLVLALYTRWFPAPYAQLVGAERLPWLILFVDVVGGPMLTAIVYDPLKRRRELATDLSVIALLQLTALAYGIHAMAMARPVVVAFEVDRFEVVIAADIEPASLASAPGKLRSLSLSGPRTVCTRASRDGEERWSSIMRSMNGQPPAQRPDWWLPYDECRQQVIERMQPLAQAQGKATRASSLLIEEAARHTGQEINGLYYLPLTRQQAVDRSSILLDEQGMPVGHVGMSGF